MAGKKLREFPQGAKGDSRTGIRGTSSEGLPGIAAMAELVGWGGVKGPPSGSDAPKDIAGVTAIPEFPIL